MLTDEDILNDTDDGIAGAVMLLRREGFDIKASCEGGDEPHVYRHPVVEFDAPFYDGFRALSIAEKYQWPVRHLHRSWEMNESGEIHGPFWTLEFFDKVPKELYFRVINHFSSHL